MLDKSKNSKALIFDLDGTLVDSMPAHYLSWCEVAREDGFYMSEEIFYELAGIPSSKVALILNERFGYDLDPKTIQKRKEYYFLRNIQKINLLEPVVKVVKKYTGQVPMAIGTGARKDIALRLMGQTGLNKYFEIIVTAEDVVAHKPDPETFVRCAKLLGFDNKVCEVFEDGELGLRAARTAGMIARDVRPYI